MENKQQRKIILVSLLCIAFTVVAKLLFPVVFKFFEPIVPGISFTIIERNPWWKTSWLFAVLIGVLPFVFPGLWQLGRIVSTGKRSLSVIIVLLPVAAAVYLRHSLVRNYFIFVVVPYYLKKGQTNVVYPIDPVNFVYYMSVGLLAGLLLAWLLLKNRRLKQL